MEKIPEPEQSFVREELTSEFEIRSVSLLALTSFFSSDIDRDSVSLLCFSIVEQEVETTWR